MQEQLPLCPGLVELCGTGFWRGKHCLPMILQKAEKQNNKKINFSFILNFNREKDHRIDFISSSDYKNLDFFWQSLIHTAIDFFCFIQHLFDSNYVSIYKDEFDLFF